MENPSEKDEEKGDDVLRRLLKTPPDHKTGKGKEPTKDEKDELHPKRD